MLNIKTVLFQVIQFSKSSQFTSIWPIDRPLSGATTPCQSEPERRGTPDSLNLQHYCNLIIWLFSVISRTPIEKVLPLCSGAVRIFYSLKRLGHNYIGLISLFNGLSTLVGYLTSKTIFFGKQELYHWKYGGSKGVFQKVNIIENRCQAY